MKGPFPLAIIMLPCIVLLAAYVFLAGNCNEDFCPALLWEAGVALVAVSALVAWAGSALLRRGRGLFRSGAAAWSTAIAVGALVFAGSQLFEGDVVPAIFAIIIVLAASFFAWSAARSPHATDPTHS